jgi:hypothetical protein
MIMDELSSVTVKLVDGTRPLLNADDDALMAGANLAMLGDELIQFGRADETAAGMFRLSRLLRGRRGTEWAASDHTSGEPFCMIDPAVRPVEVPVGAIGASLTAIAHGVGDVAPLPQFQWPVVGEALRPPSPCRLKLWRDSAGDLCASWTRRSHRGWTWIDETGVPDDPFPERYRIRIDGAAGTTLIETEAPNLLASQADLPGETGEEIGLSVATVGPRAVSREISATIIL